MSYLIFRGVSTESLGHVYVSQMPSHKKAGMRMTEYYVKGRDGALHVNEGYSNFQLQTVLVLVDGGADRRQLVNAWADGTGKLVTSDDLTKAFKATVIDEVRWKRVKAAGYIQLFSPYVSYVAGQYVRHSGTVYRFTDNHPAGDWTGNDVAVASMVINGLYDTATITFDCQPFMYESVDSTVVLTASGTIYNPGSAISFPLIQVDGSGNVSFNFAGNDIQISGMTANVPVYIDCENGYIWTPEGTASIVGNIPELAMGENTIAFGENVTSITVTPRWRWI